MGSEHIAHIRVIQVLPVADNWIDEDGLGVDPLDMPRTPYQASEGKRSQ